MIELTKEKLLELLQMDELDVFEKYQVQNDFANKQFYIIQVEFNKHNWVNKKFPVVYNIIKETKTIDGKKISKGCSINYSKSNFATYCNVDYTHSIPMFMNTGRINLSKKRFNKIYWMSSCQGHYRFFNIKSASILTNEEFLEKYENEKLLRDIIE